MTERELAKLLAKRFGTSTSRAADQVGRQLYEIVRQLRSGRPANLPGLGMLYPTRLEKVSARGITRVAGPRKRP